MKTKKFDIAVAGNGMIGVLTSFLLKEKYPQKKICLIGNKYYKNSASTAAGAMHAVFCEIEENFYKSKLEQSNFNIGLKSRVLWKEIFKKYGLRSSITSNDTFFYIKNLCSSFERNNFETACDVANKYKVLKKTSKYELEKNFNGRLNIDDLKCFKIKNEFSFNPVNLINKFLNLSKKNKMHLIYEDINSILSEDKKYLINEKYLADILIVAGGYNSHELAKNLFKPIPVIKGVGTAFIIKHNHFKNFSEVIRTSNRGGQQCGLHLVPYNQKKGEVYVGAGNYLSIENAPWARTETIKYLIQLLQEELIPKKIIYHSTIKPLLGYRPRSIDNIPSIGPVNDSLFYVSGTNRVGLSWASYIADEIVKWVGGKENDSLITLYEPNRKIKSWGKINDASNYYASSRLSNLMEHNLVKKNEFKKKFDELYRYAKDKNLYFNKKFKLKKNFVIDPDCYVYFEKTNKKNFNS